MHKKNYIDYVTSSNLAGSNKAPSYIKALDWLCKMLEVEAYSFRDCINIWNVRSSTRVHELYEFVLQERQKDDKSPWKNAGIPPSYLEKGYCSAALKNYEAFLVEQNYENDIFHHFESYAGDESELHKSINLPLNLPDYLLEEFRGKQGKDVVRVVQTRVNQNIFRRIVLSIYNQSCCITGLNIPEINRASHIIPWAKDEKKRLDPTNGLCLSATYDAAFDRNLISLDDDYRIILSKNLRDYVTNKSINEYFLKKEGMTINLPNKFKPNKNYLAEHRKHGQY